MVINYFGGNNEKWELVPGVGATHRWGNPSLGQPYVVALNRATTPRWATTPRPGNHVGLPLRVFFAAIGVYGKSPGIPRMHVIGARPAPSAKFRPLVIIHRLL